MNTSKIIVQLTDCRKTRKMVRFHRNEKNKVRKFH